MPPSFRRLLAVRGGAAGPRRAGLAPPRRDPADPRAPVAALYAIEKSGHAPLATPAQRAAALTRGLAAMWDKAEARARGGGDAAIDFDVVTNSQGAAGEVLRADGRAARRQPRDRRRDHRPRRLAARSPRENVITFSLLRQAGRWRVDDVSGVAEPNAWSLRDMLARALKAR